MEEKKVFGIFTVGYVNGQETADFEHEVFENKEDAEAYCKEHNSRYCEYFCDSVILHYRKENS